MPDEYGRGDDGRRRYSEIAAEFGVTRPTIYCHLQARQPACDAVGER